ncbi:MAG: DUF6913 domain-containing protein [Candidatus Cryptobacteroides sp.]
MLRGLLRKRCLRRDEVPVPGGFIPLDKASSMTLVLDVSVPDWEDCHADAETFCRKHSIELNILYIDLVHSADKAVSDVSRTIFKKDLNWYGKPSDRKASVSIDHYAGIFVCLCNSGNWCVEYLSRVTQAHFRIGMSRWKDYEYDFTVTPEEGNLFKLKEVFSTIAGLLESVKE